MSNIRTSSWRRCSGDKKLVRWRTGLSNETVMSARALRDEFPSMLRRELSAFPRYGSLLICGSCWWHDDGVNILISSLLMFRFDEVINFYEIVFVKFSWKWPVGIRMQNSTIFLGGQVKSTWHSFVCMLKLETHIYELHCKIIGSIGRMRTSPNRTSEREFATI